ncbi:MAG: Hsp20/alpha crystallin family protein, partial [Actinomycetota bacterium]
MSLPTRREAELETRDPFRELDDLHERMTDLMRSAFGRGPSEGMFRWEPPVDIEETDDAFLVEADVPGVKQDDLDVELVDNQLTVRGETRERERVG